jgi:hypothetical protein
MSLSAETSQELSRITKLLRLVISRKNRVAQWGEGHPCAARPSVLFELHLQSKGPS